MNKTITTETELKEFINRNQRAVVVFGKKDCLLCSIVETVIDDIEKQYPLVAFGFTTDREIADKHHIEAYPVMAFYENGNIMGTLVLMQEARQINVEPPLFNIILKRFQYFLPPCL